MCSTPMGGPPQLWMTKLRVSCGFYELVVTPPVAESDRFVEFEADPHREKKAFFAFRLQSDSGAGG